MGHSDSVVIADAHFPADRLAERLLTFPGLPTPDVLAAVRTVIPLDDAPRGYAEFDKGAAKKYVIDPHGMIPAA